ncbi:MAG: hypothetical protein ABIJ47_04260 [Candidatus Bathyarchaeota archaeon]
MNRKVSTLIALMIVGALPAFSLYTSAVSLSAWSPGQEFTADGAVSTAKTYLKGMPTYAFDGMADTIELVKVEPLRMLNTWEVTIAFTSRHSGYGYRAGQMLAQVLTSHVTRIVVSEGRVIRAVTDEAFDEMEERMLPTGDTTAEEAESIALSFLRDSPTFKFDGIEASISVSEVFVMESYPVQYAFMVTFECSHPGYGDRAGQVLAQVITPHEIRIVVSAGEVLSAVIDGEWDELNQAEEVRSEFLPPEMARDLALRYILENFPQLAEMAVPEEWEFTDLTPEGLLGASTYRYTGLDWSVTVRFMVVLEPGYTVSVEYSDDPEFTWGGEVDQSSMVTETSTSLTPAPTGILSPEEARDLAVEYVQANYPELETLKAPTNWEIQNLTPEGLLGHSTLQHTSGEWTVKIGYPVVWKPTYRVEITIDGEPSFTWAGTVAQDGTVSTAK